jgi:4-amino-4-deoxy-L-arabinose transferase-like glycosyltransferase
MSDSTVQVTPSGLLGAGIRDWRLPAPSLGRILELALFLRVLAGMGVEWYVRRRAPGRVCIFPDAEYYWSLAGTICQGTLYEIVDWGDIPHFALRTPGYPIFLAGCRAVLGDRPLVARLVQAVLGMVTVWLVYRLSLEVLGEQEIQPSLHGDSRPRRLWSVPLVAAGLTALHPYFIAMSALLLSEAVFVFWMILALWGLAVIWNRPGDGAPRKTGRDLLIAFGVGAASGVAILTRPSWAMFVPVMMAALGYRLTRLGGAVSSRALGVLRPLFIMALGLVVVMAPWWVRNASIYGRFVPTAIWMGASLYDGLNPGATGASHMEFLGDPEIWPLDELDQDRELTRRALQFARQEPGRAVRLAVIKLGRYWCPWPNAEGFRSVWLAGASAVVMVPLLAGIGLGLVHRRGDPRAWFLLAGPLIYFCILHMAFASSMRYRIPAEVPAMVLAAAGLSTMVRGKSLVLCQRLKVGCRGCPISHKPEAQAKDNQRLPRSLRLRFRLVRTRQFSVDRAPVGWAPPA